MPAGSPTKITEWNIGAFRPTWEISPRVPEVWIRVDIWVEMNFINEIKLSSMSGSGFVQREGFRKSILTR